MIVNGLSWWQSWLCVWIGYTISACFICSTGRIGATYHISFPVVSRASFGIWGSLWPVFNRAAMACIWYGVQSWIGGGFRSNVTVDDCHADSLQDNASHSCFAPYGRAIRIYQIACQPALAQTLETSSASFCFGPLVYQQFGSRSTKSATSSQSNPISYL